MHTVKMMESTLTLQDIKALREIVPRAFSIGGDGDYLVNYVELNEVLTGQSPRGDDFNSSLDRNLSTGTVSLHLLEHVMLTSFVDIEFIIKELDRTF